MNPTRIQVISEGVVASYIHDISVRNASSPTPRRPAHSGRATRRRAHVRSALRGHDARPRELAPAR
jgi:hypothetical protein